MYIGIHRFLYRLYVYDYMYIFVVLKEENNKKLFQVLLTILTRKNMI